MWQIERPTRSVFGSTQAMRELIHAKSKQHFNRLLFRQKYAPVWPESTLYSTRRANEEFNWVVDFELHEYAEPLESMQVKKQLLFVKANSAEEAKRTAWQLFNAIYRMDFFNQQEKIAGVRRGTPWSPRIFTILSVFPRP